MLGLSKILLSELEAGGTLVVPSRQRAAAVRLAYASARLSRGELLWRTPDVQAYGSWLERESRRAAESGDRPLRALSPAEEWLLWRQAAAEAMRDEDVAPNDALVEALQRSARVLFEWRIPPSTLERAGDPESELLARTLQILEARCEQMGALAAHRLIEQLHSSVPRAPVAFAGFSERTAARMALCQRWSEHGALVREHQPDGAAGIAFVAEAQDAQDELARAAAWCREQLDEDPSRRLLVVVPDLIQRRHEVAQAFEEALNPQSILAAEQAVGPRLYAIEGGQALSAYPLVAHALATLRLLSATLDFARWSAWLRSSFWSAAHPLSARARLEAALRRILDIEVGLSELIAALDAVPSELSSSADSLRKTLIDAAETFGSAGGKAGAYTWCRRFQAALRALGWPGARPLSSAEQQTLTRCMDLFGDFAALGPGLGSLTAVEAVHTLEVLARRTSYEPATGDPAVTLTGSLGDPVVRYDGIWIAGLHADAWPRPVSIDPFIPLAAQRQAGIPSVQPARMLEQARGMLRLWRRSAERLVLSWPRREEDRELLASPLLGELEGACSWEPRSSQPSLARVLHAARSVESYDDSQGEPWPTSVPVPAGTRTIEYQNRCPVRAYAELRLGSSALDSPRPGVDVRERGVLLHRALELLWTRLGGSQELKAAHGPKLDALIDESVERAMADAFGTGGVYQQNRALVREHRRAARLIRELCELELARPPFRVRWLEARRTWAGNGCSLDLRIDRIDELEDGTHVIFDYKSGMPQGQEWAAERLTHPQLLVYMLACGAEVTALATVQLTPSRVSFRGIADRKGRLPRVSALEADGDAPPEKTWKAQQERWRQSIERLAGDFLAGSAPLAPLENACRTCHLHVFCRIADALASETDTDE